MTKPRIKETIIVEGRYDKNTLSQCVDASIIETGGFRVFKNNDLKDLVRRLAKTRGVIILTDSDSAGFVIRNHLKGIVNEGIVKHAYIPGIKGRERRKYTYSAEKTLGVEGMKAGVLISALKAAGATFEDTVSEERGKDKAVTKSVLFELGYSGGSGSSEKRKALLKRLNLPVYLNVSSMLDIINELYSYDEAIRLLGSIR